MAGTDLEMWLSDSMSAEFIVDYLCKSAIRPLSNGVRFFSLVGKQQLFSLSTMTIRLSKQRKSKTPRQKKTPRDRNVENQQRST